MTGEGWTDVQYYLMDSAGYFEGILFIFFVMAGGNLLMMNLSLAVVFTCYNEQKTKAEQKAKAQVRVGGLDEQYEALHGRN